MKLWAYIGELVFTVCGQLIIAGQIKHSLATSIQNIDAKSILLMLAALDSWNSAVFRAIWAQTCQQAQQLMLNS